MTRLTEENKRFIALQTRISRNMKKLITQVLNILLLKYNFPSTVTKIERTVTLQVE